MAECNHDCGSCGQNCGDRTEPQSLLKPANAESNIKRVIGIVSGKGGVGKSLITSLTACAVRKDGKKVAVLDADITGPSIPKMFGLGGIVEATDTGIIPATASNGVEVMSVNLMLEHNDDPVIWRGPVIGGVVEQFWTDVIWGDVDYMFVDMPPGTGDVPLTVFQSLPVDGIIVVTSPQDLVGMIVGKAVKMAAMMNIPVLGIVENMSYFKCPECGHNHNIFGESKIVELADNYGIATVCKLPMDPKVAAACDAGNVMSLDVPELDPIVKVIESIG